MCRANPSSKSRAFGRRDVLVALLALAAIAAVGLPDLAIAQERPLDQPRAQGIVGERYDGLAVLRQSGASASVQALLDDINGKRRALYQRRAAAEGVPATEIGKIYAKEIFRSAPGGTWFQQENGTWLQK